jgi:hypothetical protein
MTIIRTIYVISTPAFHSPEVFIFNATSYLIANTIYEVVAWGYDSNGDGYFMTYDGPTTGTGSPSDLTIYSRIEGGLGNALRSAIVQAFTGFENSELTQGAESLKKVPLDGRRAGMPLVSCDQACTENEDFKGLGL